MVGLVGENREDIRSPGCTEDSKMLLVEKDLADTLQGTTIDVEETPAGVRLVISSEP